MFQMLTYDNISFFIFSLKRHEVQSFTRQLSAWHEYFNSSTRYISPSISSNLYQFNSIILH